MQLRATFGLIPIDASAAHLRRARRLLARAGLHGGQGATATLLGDASGVLAAAHRLRTLVQAEAGRVLAAVICLGGAPPPPRPALGRALQGGKLEDASAAPPDAPPPGRTRVSA